MDGQARTRDMLAARRQALLDALAGLDAAAAPVVLDQARVGRLSRMEAMQDQAMAKAGQQRVALELKRIDAALVRLHEGRYGACVDCGDDVGDRRLQVDPAATLCIRCASLREGA